MKRGAELGQWSRLRETRRQQPGGLRGFQQKLDQLDLMTCLNPMAKYKKWQSSKVRTVLSTTQNYMDCGEDLSVPS